MSAMIKLFLLPFAILQFAAPLFAQEKILFPVAASTKSAGFSPLWAALKQGFFAQPGLDVQLVVIDGTDKAMQTSVGGSV
jgi:ABC-type nitrate/sulfonate/bicarbonate transport system substrate-binding protein